MNKKKAGDNKTGSKRITLPKIKATRKNAIVNEVHDRIRTLEGKRTFGLKEQAAELKAWLEQQPEIESVSLYGDSDLTLKFKDKTQVGILLGRKNMYGGSGPEGEVVVATKS